MYMLNNAFDKEGPKLKYIIVGFVVCVFIIARAACCIDNRLNSKYKILNGKLCCFLLLVWFFVSGWFLFVSKKTIQINSLNSCQWQKMARYIDEGKSPLCVPLNHWRGGGRFFYGRNCYVLPSKYNPKGNFVDVKENRDYLVAIPENLLNKRLISAVVFVKPLSLKSNIEGVMHIKLKNGYVKNITGIMNPKKEYILMLQGDTPISIRDIDTANISFSSPVKVRMIDGSDFVDAVLMGN